MARSGFKVTDAGEQIADSSPEQGETLLRTKLFTPPVRSDRVTRPRLYEQIDRGLDKTLILISAPAGYGKTTLVSAWLHETEISSTWISLDEDDNDPIRFLHYLITALHQIALTIQIDLMGVLQNRQPASIKFLLNILINELARRTDPFVLVLDDFHTIHAQPVVEILTHLIEHAPPQMHVVLLSRTDPFLPLARLRARNQLIEIRADQLRFTQEEIALFLNDMRGLKLSRNDITALAIRTEGWIAGIQLASIAMQATALHTNISAQGGKDVHGFISAFSGSHYYIMDYLAEEVLKLQTETVGTFLLQSSILERMCGALCDEVIGADKPGAGDGQAMLEALEQMNLFIIPLDSKRGWFRYHHLFADVLNRRLEQFYPQLVPELHRRASRWHEQNGYVFEAIRHTLMAGERERAAQMIDQYGCQLLMRGEVNNLLHWIEAVEPYSQTLPWIAIQKAWSLYLSGHMDEAEGPLQIAERIISSLPMTDEVGTMSGAVIAAQAYRANVQGKTRLAADLARRALNCLPISTDFSCSLRSVATSLLGDANWIEGNLAEAQRAYIDAVQISQAAGNVHMLIIANSNLADIWLEQGRLHQAARKYGEILQMASLPDWQISPLAERAYAGLSRVSYEWNHLEDAAEYIQECIDLSRRWGNSGYLATGEVMLARLEKVASNPDKAREAMRAAEQLISDYAINPWQSTFVKSALARLQIDQGDLKSASYLVEKSGITGDDDVTQEGGCSFLQEPVYLTLLRLHLARGDNDAALALSEGLLQKIDETQRAGRVIELLVLRALAFQGKKDTNQALAVLEKAFSVAQPEGYVRVFLDEGELMAKLLYQAKARLVGSGYAAELLSAMGHAPGRALPPAELLIKPLTLRELEVLKLIETGCSNQEIAAELVISMPTVKRHISNIYTKLGASSRTQAVSRGKELNLFE